MFRASALTFYTLMSIVPVLAMAFGIAKGFGFQEALERQLYENFYGHQEIIDQITVFAQSMLESTKGGLIAGVGVLILFWAVIRVLGNVENAFNHILEFPRSRTIGRKISDYMATMLICTVLLVVSSAFTVAIKSHVTSVVQSFAILGSVSPVIFFLLKLLPYCAIWLLFAILYMFLPNGKIKLRYGLARRYCGRYTVSAVSVGLPFFSIWVSPGTMRFTAVSRLCRFFWCGFRSAG